MARLVSLTACRIALLVSWLSILGLAVAHIQNGRKILFRNATGVGLTAEDVTRMAGTPDAVVAAASELDSPTFERYHHSRRPVSARVLVYFRFGKMIAVYLDDRDQVVATYWGDRLTE